MPREIAERYLIKNLLGEGRYGKVYRAKDYQTQTKVAVKIINGHHKSQYKNELNVLKGIKEHKVKGFLNVSDYGFEEGSNIFYIVTQILGKDLQFLINRCQGKKFKIQTAIKIGLQMFKRIRDFHRAGYIHRDIKLSNFVIPPEQNEASPQGNSQQCWKNLEIYLIDYGICKANEVQNFGDFHQRKNTFQPLSKSPLIRKKDHFMGQQMQYFQEQKKEKSFVGTLYFASINQLKKMEMSAKDDLESLGYVIMNMITGTLPWRDLMFMNDLQDMNQQMVKMRNPIYFSKSLPSELIQYIKDVQGLRSTDLINYKYLKGLLKGVEQRLDFSRTMQLDWVLVNEQEQQEYLRSLTMKKNQRVQDQELGQICKEDINAFLFLSNGSEEAKFHQNGQERELKVKQGSLRKKSRNPRHKNSKSPAHGEEQKEPFANRKASKVNKKLSTAKKNRKKGKGKKSRAENLTPIKENDILEESKVQSQDFNYPKKRPGSDMEEELFLHQIQQQFQDLGQPNANSDPCGMVKRLDREISVRVREELEKKRGVQVQWLVGELKQVCEEWLVEKSADWLQKRIELEVLQQMRQRSEEDSDESEQNIDSDFSCEEQANAQEAIIQRQNAPIEARKVEESSQNEEDYNEDWSEGEVIVNLVSESRTGQNNLKTIA